MKFEKILKRVIPKREEEHPLSRLYGYAFQNGKARVIESESEVISRVISNIAIRQNETLTEIIDDLLFQCDQENIRNRSGKKWTSASLLGLVRPVYGGIYVNQFGSWKRSKIYPAIVSIDSIRSARKRLNSEKILK